MDTNDDMGVAPDLSAIRGILDTLDEENASGNPVRATWDFDNNYTLGRILSNFGSDIISRIKGRCLSGKDEVMLASYNGGILSAMTDDEFSGSLQLAETNPDGTGVRDMFGSCSLVLRPEQSAFHVSQIPMYAEAGVRAICLYYSTGVKDALRFCLPLMGDVEIYNPIKVTCGEDEDTSMAVLPMTDMRDVYRDGSLTATISRIREKQLLGNITRDVFIFINMDVRDELWKPMKVQGLSKLAPCTSGLKGLLKEIKKLGYVVYNTPGEYMETHECVASATFGQDIASGGMGVFDESPWTHRIWTKLERARLSSAVYSQDCASPSFGARVSLLSAAHFTGGGMNLSPVRRERALELTAQMDEEERAGLLEKGLALRTSGRQRLNDSAIGRNTYSRRKDDEERCTFTLLNPSEHPFMAVQLSTDPEELRDIRKLSFTCDECGIESWTALSMERERLPIPRGRRFSSEAEKTRLKEEKEASEEGISSILLLIRFTSVRKSYKLYYSISGENRIRPAGKPIIEIHDYELPVFNPVGAMRRLLEAQGKLPPEEIPPVQPAEAEQEEQVNPLPDETAEIREAQHKPADAEEEKLPDHTEIATPSGDMRVIVSTAGPDKGHIHEVIYRGRRVGGPQFLRQYLRYDGADYVFQPVLVHPVTLSGYGEGLTILGEIHIPGELEKGLYQLDIVTTPVMEPLLIRSDVRYPRTAVKDILDNGALTDNAWQGVAPFEITPVPAKGIRMIRRDFTGDVSSYAVADQIKNAAASQSAGAYASGNAVTPGDAGTKSFNRHLTGGIIGVKDSDGYVGVMVANARYVLGGIAFCPVTVRGDILKQEISLNLFGTDPETPEADDRLSAGVHLVNMIDSSERGAVPEKASAFNGVRERAVMGLMCFAGEAPRDDYKEELKALCDGALVSGDETGHIHPFMGDNVFEAADAGDRRASWHVVPERGNTFAVKRDGDSPDIIKAKKDLIRHFKNSLRR